MDEALSKYDEWLKTLDRAVELAGDPVSIGQMITINQQCAAVKMTYEMLHRYHAAMSPSQQEKFQALAQKHRGILKDYANKGPREAPPGI